MPTSVNCAALLLAAGTLATALGTTSLRERLDVLQKMKAEGYNAVSMYFDWGYHSAAPGQYDFTGIRNMGQALDMAAQAGLYVIARPGPYINAEVTGGGLPGYLSAQAGRARSNAPDYLASADQWLGAIDPILRRHQLTNGTGTVILYQIENEFGDTSASGRASMQNLAAKAHADGITVPLFHNDQDRSGLWVPPCMAQCEGPGYERVFYDTNIANGLSMQNVYRASPAVAATTAPCCSSPAGTWPVHRGRGSAAPSWYPMAC